jgi:hypothetical protein
MNLTLDTLRKARKLLAEQDKLPDYAVCVCSPVDAQRVRSDIPSVLDSETPFEFAVLAGIRLFETNDLKPGECFKMRDANTALLFIENLAYLKKRVPNMPHEVMLNVASVQASLGQKCELTP